MRRNPDTASYTDPHTDPHAAPHRHSDADAYSYAYAYTHSNTYPQSYTDPHTYSHRAGTRRCPYIAGRSTAAPFRPHSGQSRAAPPRAQRPPHFLGH